MKDFLRGKDCLERLFAAVDRFRSKSNGRVTIAYLERAEKIWYQQIQCSCFISEINALKNKENLNKNSKLISLTPILDNDNILRANGRLRKFPENIFQNQPIVLCSSQYVTRLIIRYYHEKCNHNSFNIVMNEVRQKYWILGLRNTLRNLAYKCFECRKLRANLVSPAMADLPVGCLAYLQRPFTHCGVDYFGPLFVKIGRRREKRWGVIFTCLTTRAVHLELAHSLSTDSAILAVQRMSARRGMPTVIYSDCGTNFKGASKELKQALLNVDKEKQHDFGIKNNFFWKFNPSNAPHMKGAWERLIRTIKVSLYSILKEQCPREEVLVSVFAQVENIVNSRPITKLSTDPQDGDSKSFSYWLFVWKCAVLYK